MPLRKLNLTLLTSLWAFAACNTPPNFFACADLGESGHCVEYMTKKTFEIDSKHPYKGKTWAQVRAGSADLPSDQLAIIKTYFDDFCHQNTCPNNVGDWSGFADSLSQHLKP